MKQYIKILTTGVGAGAAAALLMDLAVRSWLSKPPHIGGEFLLPVLIGLVGYIGWDLANAYFREVKHKEIYRQGFSDGTKVNTYNIVIPITEDDDENQM